MRSLNSLAAPIFDHEKKLVGVITTYSYKAITTTPPAARMPLLN
jgi:transcriptional regulator of acetoin/glycerol metabolism